MTVSTPRRSTTRSTTTGPKGDVRPETLAEFSATLDEHAGTPVGFAELVSDLGVTRAQISEMKKARSALFEQIKGAYDVGHRVVVGTDYELRQTEPGGGEPYRAVDSATAKKTDAAAWQRAHVAVSYVNVRVPDTARVRVMRALERLPELPSPAATTSVAAAVITYKEHPAWSFFTQLIDQQNQLIEALDKLAADFGWDGLPITFADGWVVGLRRRQYSSEALAEVAPALFDRLAVTKTRAGNAHVYVVKQDDTGHDDTVDLDGD